MQQQEPAQAASKEEPMKGEVDNGIPATEMPEKGMGVMKELSKKGSKIQLINRTVKKS